MSAKRDDMAIQDAIRALYDVFRPYEVGPPLDACPCCVPQAGRRLLSQRPLHALSWDDLEVYVSKAITTFGSVDHFKHFLPRILELLASDREASLADDLIRSHLSYARWREWPMAEQEAVERFLHALWRHVIESEDSTISVYTCLTLIASLLQEVRESLQIWSETMDRVGSAGTQVAAFLCDWDFERGMRQDSNAGRDLRSELDAWLRRAETARRIRHALAQWALDPQRRCPDGMTAEDVEGCHDEYERWRSGGTGDAAT